MADMSYEFEAVIWLYSGKAAWHFVSVPEDISEHIKAFSSTSKPGFGSVRVSAQIGGTRWQTSLFPDAKANCYHLPLKADVRKREKLKVDANVLVTLDIDVDIER